MPRPPIHEAKPTLRPVQWRRRLILGGALACAILAAVCALVGSGWSAARLPDVSKQADIVLTSGGRGLLRTQSGLSIHITGDIDGVAEVWASNWGVQRLSGRVDWQVYHDWFSPDCTLHYQPVGPVSGRLAIRYRFH